MGVSVQRKVEDLQALDEELQKEEERVKGEHAEKEQVLKDIRSKRQAIKAAIEFLEFDGA